ncbi:hypothetical protein DRJ04_09350 [Candidatus Aerophobetes bacterium]|uniref:CARDB domain-containing protein n=1 Tax=Aerophobetes bacterium TaxID=2030807 RepID=A0A662D7X5_UNCAE|nr:MAG: hypothetical protein DRJ04_09350 [Candidatus Aerophobetes bacterium]
MNVRFFTVLLVMGLIPAVAALDVDVNVESVIQGSLAWINISTKPPQKISITWENIGSVGCEVRARADFYNTSKLVYTGWSRAKPLWPGSHADMDIYSNLPEGNYTVYVRIYFCNEIFKFGPYYFEGKPKKSKAGNFEIVNIDTFDDYIDIYIRSNQDVKNLIVIPSKYPVGWIMESARIDFMNSGQIKKARIPYRPSIWKESSVEFTLITEDGNFIQKKTVLLKKEKSRSDAFAPFIIILMLIILLIIYLSYKIKLNIWRAGRD